MFSPHKFYIASDSKLVYLSMHKIFVEYGPCADTVLGSELVIENKINAFLPRRSLI